jgi:hypothetical protein
MQKDQNFLNSIAGLIFISETRVMNICIDDLGNDTCKLYLISQSYGSNTNKNPWSQIFSDHAKFRSISVVKFHSALWLCAKMAVNLEWIKKRTLFDQKEE